MSRRLLPLIALVFAACSSPSGDAHLDPGTPSAIGTGSRIRDIANPGIATHPKNLSNVNVTGASVLWSDTYDETSNGKSRGTVYVQDVGASDPYSGLSLYSPTFIPGDLRLAPGDVLNLVGQYQENDHIGTAIFPAPQVLPQISKPIGTFRYEFQPPAPHVIDVADLDDWATGRQWLNMLVTVNDVTLSDDLDDEGTKASKSPTGRVTAHMTASSKCKLVNELMPLAPQSMKAGTTVKSITGVVTYFFDLHLAPRTPDDIVQ